MRLANNKTSFLSSIFSDVILSKDSTEISVRCPYCGTPGKSKMCIIIDSGVYHCWVCESKGRGLARLITKVRPGKVKEYIQNYAPSERLKSKEEIANEEPDIELPEDFKLVTQGNKADPDWREIARYAKFRGFTKKSLWEFRVGYSRSFEWRRRLILPSFDEDGMLNYLTGRSIDPENTFRYKNLSRSRNSVIFNGMDVDWKKPLFLSEGPLDLIKVKMNKTCLLGSTLSTDSLLFEKIVSNSTPVIMILDDDAKKKAVKIADSLVQYDIPLKINFCSREADLNELSEKRIKKLIDTSQEYDYSFKLKLKLGSYKL
jgi:hypothetical protein